MKVLDVKWFCGSSNVGIARCLDEYTGEIKYYISAVEGINEHVDRQRIADFGSRFPTHVGDILFGIR